MCVDNTSLRQTFCTRDGFLKFQQTFNKLFFMHSWACYDPRLFQFNVFSSIFSYFLFKMVCRRRQLYLILLFFLILYSLNTHDRYKQKQMLKKHRKKEKQRKKAAGRKIKSSTKYLSTTAKTEIHPIFNLAVPKIIKRAYLCFLHIPKTGGTTFNNFINK